MRTGKRLGILLVCVLAPLPGARGDVGLYEPGVDPAVGFNLISWWNFGAAEEAVWAGAVQDLYDHGFRCVSLAPVRFFDPASGAVAGSSPGAPELSHVAAGLARAKSLGMTVTVNPFVEPAGFAFWRGQWDPTPGGPVAAQFWTDYAQYLTDVAAMAEAGGADRMTVGTELRAITRNAGHNAGLSAAIAAADASFAGQLGYAANWDNYRHGNLSATVWDNPHVDFMGIDAYFPLASPGEADASGAHPDTAFISIVEASWNGLLDGEILPFARDRKGGEGMPVVFTEHGLTPYNQTTAEPWSEGPYWRGEAIDADEQVNGYHALISAADARGDELEEIHLWQWGMPGAEDSLWFLDPNGEDDEPGSKFDESLGRAAARFLTGYVNTSRLPGDADFDGDVDYFDYAILRDHFGLGGGTWATGDFDADTEVGFRDYVALKGHFGEWLGAGGAGVPEPASLWLLAAGGAVALRRRRRGRRAAIPRSGE